MGKGFYKLIGGAISHASRRVITADGTFNVSEHLDYEYPIAGGWYYFETYEDAEVFFNVKDSEAVPMINGVPVQVTPAQCDLALDGIGKLDALNAMIDNSATPNEVRIRYRRATAIRRDSPFVVQLGHALGLSDKQIDDLFVAAAKL